MFGFYEELLSTRFPHSSYKLVFVDQAYRDVSSYSTLGIFRYIYMYMLWLLNVCAHAHVCNDINAPLMYVCVCVCKCTCGITLAQSVETLLFFHCSTNLLHSARIIDQVLVTRRIIANAIAEQYFGCYILPQQW